MSAGANSIELLRRKCLLSKYHCIRNTEIQTTSQSLHILNVKMDGNQLNIAKQKDIVIQVSLLLLQQRSHWSTCRLSRPQWIQGRQNRHSISQLRRRGRITELNWRHLGCSHRSKTKCAGPLAAESNYNLSASRSMSFLICGGELIQKYCLLSARFSPWNEDCHRSY